MGGRGQSSGILKTSAGAFGGEVGGAKPENRSVVTLEVVKDAMARVREQNPGIANQSATAMATAVKNELSRMGYDVNTSTNKITDGNIQFNFSKHGNAWSVTQSEKKK